MPHRGGKPFGHDLESAQALNATLAQYFDEKQIYRIDHYLGKETVQNLMAVRFGNILFEPPVERAVCRSHPDYCGRDRGRRWPGGVLRQVGAMRDMMQNHLMQLLCLIAMEPPYCFEPDAVRDEKLKVIRALDPVPAGRHRAWAICRGCRDKQLSGGCREQRQRHRIVHRDEAARVELALEGHTDLHPHR